MKKKSKSRKKKLKWLSNVDETSSQWNLTESYL